jgi:hypothetical protein
MDATKVEKKKASVSITVVLLAAWFTSTEFEDFEIKKYTKIQQINKYGPYNVILDQSFVDHQDMIEFFFRLIKETGSLARPPWRIIGGATAGNGCYITELSGDMSGVVHLRTLVGMILQAGGKKDSIVVHLVKESQVAEEPTTKSKPGKGKKKEDDEDTPLIKPKPKDKKLIKSEPGEKKQTGNIKSSKLDTIEVKPIIKQERELNLDPSRLVPFEMNTRKTTRKRSWTDLSHGSAGPSTQADDKKPYTKVDSGVDDTDDSFDFNLPSRE